MVKYLSGDFTPADFASCGVGFSGSAQGPGSSRTETVRVGRANGGRIGRDSGGKVDDYVPTHEPADQPDTIDVDEEASRLRRGDFASRMSRRLRETNDRMPNPGGDANKATRDTGEINDFGAPPPEIEARKGGRIKRAIGGVIPGQAATAEMQPLSRQQTQAPMGGPTDDPLARAQVTMPYDDVGRLAIHAAGAGAKGAMGVMSQLAARNRGAAPRVMPGAAAIAPGAAPPAPPMQGGLGVPLSAAGAAMKKGGRVRRADGGPVNPGGQKITPEENFERNRAFLRTTTPDVVSARVPGGVRSKYNNLTSDDPETERHLRFMEASRARLSGMENVTDDNPRYTDPEDAAGYHGFSKGGRLTAAKRHALPSSSFALPGKGSGSDGKGSGSYPINDPKHGRLALSMVSKYGSPAEKSRVRAAVHRKFPGIGKE